VQEPGIFTFRNCSGRPFDNSLSHLLPQKIINDICDNSENNYRIYMVVVPGCSYFLMNTISWKSHIRKKAEIPGSCTGPLNYACKFYT